MILGMVVVVVVVVKMVHDAVIALHFDLHQDVVVIL